MIIPLEPILEGLAERRFVSFARQMLDRQGNGDATRISALVDAETTRASSLRDLEGQCDEYTACVRVLGDLAQLRWTLVDTGYGLELHSPRSQDRAVSDPAQQQLRKDAIRNELRPRVLQQFADPNVLNFIRRMERPPESSKRKSIRMLIADGAELQQRLSAARQLNSEDPARAEALRVAVQPYLQLVDPGIRDDWTGVPLRDIWRYFRYTWSIPQTPIPGRSLTYLVRDAAHSTHAVIGIAALSNCPVQLVPRDHAIGWSTAGLVDALNALFAPRTHTTAHKMSKRFLQYQGVYQWLKQLFPDQTDLSSADKCRALHHVLDWLYDGISNAIGEIECEGLATRDEIAAPTPQVIKRLRRRSQEFATRRQELLAGRVDHTAETAFAEVPVDDDLLDLEAKHSSNAPVHNSRPMLVRKKRAFELARLLDARRSLAANREVLTDPETALAAFDREHLRTAVNTAIGAIKGRRIGTNILDMTTCGAVAPYNRILGGKLVALLLLSPEVAANNRRRYGQEPTIIRSQLKNKRVIPDNTLAWLGTTSLYSHGSSQYERLRLPAGVIAPDQPEIRFTYLGDTSGYGTVQFADDTVRALEVVLHRKRGYRDVNGVFGEGASPRLRKLRSGLDAIGFHAALTMLHHQERRIYGIPLFDQAGAYLCGLGAIPPNYVTEPESFTDATARIANFWRQRWLSSRLAHARSWTALGETRPLLLSATIPRRDSPPKTNGVRDSTSRYRVDDERGLEFWRRLADAGSNAVAEGLTADEFTSIHLETPLESHLLEMAREGLSIVLTGNAGDGKTHLAKALQRGLKTESGRFDFAFDATAIMTSKDDVDPVVERWCQAQNAGKAIVLAINQYPLYMLRRKLRHALPGISAELERQWKGRLVIGDTVGHPESDSLLLVDLSLRNPLSLDFASRVLRMMLGDSAIRRHADSGEDANFSYNFQRLDHPTVQQRIFELFERVISSGHRTTVRELWVLTARLLFGRSTDHYLPGAPQAWYSQRLFDHDARFPLCDALRRIADPANVSHPHIDKRLEDPGGTSPEQWLVADELPGPLPSPVSTSGHSTDAGKRHRRRFLAVKRRFYFEHKDGGPKVFELDSASNSRFHDILRHPENDTDHLSELVEAINRCYFPHQFDDIGNKLCLWIGHRLDEQPTKSFVADECIPGDRLCLQRPEPPGKLKDAMPYIPDHLILTATRPDGRIFADGSLRIDAVLFNTLSSIRLGLPRHLINPGELNRLDTFVDRLRHMAPSPLPEVLIYNSSHVTSSAIKVSAGRDRYLGVRRL